MRLRFTTHILGGIRHTRQVAGTRSSKPSSGPGRGTSRTRATTRPGDPRRPSGPRSPATPNSPKGNRRPPAAMRTTRKAIILAVLVGLLLVTYASSLRIFFDQQLQIARAEDEIARQEEAIAALQDEITRWEDPEYVKAQARSRLGWVVPGEVGYRVIGPDGEPIGGGVELESGVTPEDLESWWERLWVSAKVADEPVVAEK